MSHLRVGFDSTLLKFRASSIKLSSELRTLPKAPLNTAKCVVVAPVSRHCRPTRTWQTSCKPYGR
eukprot:5633969-Amphidinium_carterae.1